MLSYVRFTVMGFVSFLVADYRQALVVEPGFSGAAPAGHLVELSQPFDLGRIGVDDPGVAGVVALVGGEPAFLDPAVEGAPRHAEFAGEFGEAPRVGAERGCPLALRAFLAADAAQFPLPSLSRQVVVMSEIAADGDRLAYSGSCCGPCRPTPTS